MKSSNTFTKKPLVVAVSGVLAGTSPVVMAQSADDGADVLEEILVTASRREQRIEDIPYNISAVDGGDIEDQNILDSAELMRSIAGVSVIDRGYRNVLLTSTIRPCLQTFSSTTFSVSRSCAVRRVRCTARVRLAALFGT
jgi:outer membrane receptor protein involved in Fe transport